MAMTVTKEEERTFSRRLDAYVRARDFILGRWRAASTEYLTRKSLDEVPEEERPLHKEAYDFLLAHGAINFGSVQPPASSSGTPEEKPLTERDIVLALYEILRGVDFQTATEKAIRKQLAEKLGAPMEGHKRLINKHVNYVVEHLHDRETLQPLGFGEGEQHEGGDRRPQNVVVVGAGASGLAAASTLKKCGVEVTVLEARHAPGGRCIASHSCGSSSSGRVEAIGDGCCDGSETTAGKRGPWHLGELAPLPLMLRPKGISADDDSGLGSRHAAVELMEVLGQQHGLDMKEDQACGESGELPVIDPATGKPLPLERLCAASQLLQEMLLTCQFAAHQPSLRAAIDEALQQRMDKAGTDIAAAAEAAEAAAAAAAQAAAATAAVAEAASYDDIAAAAAAREDEQGGEEKQGEHAADEPKEGQAQQPNEQQQQEQQHQQGHQQQRAKQLERQQEEQQQRESQQQQAQQALVAAHTAQQELQDAARALTWQLCAFEAYARVSLCALPPSAAVHLSAALVPTGMAPGSPSAFASLFPVGGHPKPTRLPSSEEMALAQGSAERRTAMAKLQGSIIQGLGHQHLDIRLGDPVVSVAYGKDGATVRTQSGAELKAGIAILAVPLGVLQSNAISLDPPLPLWKTDVHARLGVSSSVCVALEYEAPFWRQHSGAEGGKLFGVLPTSLPPPAPPCDELAGEAASAAAAAVASAAEAGAAESTSSLGWVFEEVHRDEAGRVVVLAHALAAPGTQASKLPDSALQHAAMTALNSTAPPEVSASADTAAAAGAANGEAPAASTEKGNVDGDGVDADFSDFAHFEQIVAGEPAPDAGAERKVSAGPPPLRASVLRWDGGNRASLCRACALPGARACGLVGEDEDENLLLAAAAAPMQAALLFAGEHTVQAGLVGTVPGALLSGVREAARAHKLLLQLRIGGEIVDQEVLDETELDTGKLKADAKQRDKERRQAVKQKQKEEAKAARAEENKAKKAAAAAAKKRKKEEQEDGDALPSDDKETSDSESETDVEREVKKPRKRRQKGEKRGKGKRERSPGAGSDGEKPEGEDGEEEEEEGKKGKRGKRGRRGEKDPSTRRKKSPSEPEAEMFLDPIRYEEQQAKRGELRNFLKSVHKAMINASKDNVQPIWEIIEAAESIDNRSQLINVLLHADQDALKFMGGDDPILRILAAWVQDLAQEASTEHLLLSLFKVFERMPSRLNNVRDSGLLAAVKKLRGNDARKETRAGANELWAVWDKRFKEHNRQAAVAAAQAAAKASMAIDPLLGLDSIKQAHQPPLGGTLLPHQLLQPQPLQQQQPQDGQLQQQQQQQNGQQDVPMEEAKPQGVSVEQLDEEDRARIQALEAKLAEDERLAQEAEQKRSQEQQQQGSSSAPRLPRIPTFDEYSKKRHSKKERARSKKEGATGRSAAREDTAPGAAGVAPDAAPAAAPGAPASAPAAAGTSSGGAAVPSPLYNIVTKMLTSAVNKGELQKDRFKVMREKVIAKVASGKAEAEVHSEPYVRQNMDKIKRLVKSYIEAKQAKGKGGS